MKNNETKVGDWLEAKRKRDRIRRAAPDLLEACKAVAARCKFDDCDWLNQMLCDAIAKAEGGES